MQYYHLCSYRLRHVCAGYVLYNALVLSDVLLGEGYTIHKNNRVLLSTAVFICVVEDGTMAL